MKTPGIYLDRTGPTDAMRRTLALQQQSRERKRAAKPELKDFVINIPPGDSEIAPLCTLIKKFGPDDCCEYCQTPEGSMHKDDCPAVARRRPDDGNQQTRDDCSAMDYWIRTNQLSHELIQDQLSAQRTATGAMRIMQAAEERIFARHMFITPRRYGTNSAAQGREFSSRILELAAKNNDARLHSIGMHIRNQPDQALEIALYSLGNMSAALSHSIEDLVKAKQNERPTYVLTNGKRLKFHEPENFNT